MIHGGQKVLRDALIAALRSGRYKKAGGSLRSGDCFCVLGVACDVYDPEKWSSRPSTIDAGHWVDTYMDGSASSLPLQVAKDYGFVDQWGQAAVVVELLDSTFAVSLADLNDDGDADFAKIADLLEDGYFWKENQK